MRSMRTFVIACLVAAGCADGTSVLSVSVTSDGTVSDIDHLAVTVTELAGNRASKPVDVPVAGGTIPPTRVLPLILPASVHGMVRIDVAALSAAGATLASSSVQAEVTPSQSVRATVTLAGDALPPDLGPACSAQPDLPDDNFIDSNCDGIDGNASDAVFVDPVNGNDTTGDGTRPRPLQHLTGAAGAIALAQSQSKHQILVASGTLTEASAVVLFDGVGVFGGYDATTAWSRSDLNPRPLLSVSTTNIGVQVPVQTLPAYWDRVDVSVATVTTPGLSVYGMFVLDGTLFTLSNATVGTGEGAPGVDSVAAPQASTPATANGGVGSGSIVAECCVSDLSNTCAPGAGGTSTCGGYAGGKGNPCGNPAAPVPGTGPSAGAGGGANSAGAQGGAGTVGAPAPAAPTDTFGTVSASGYTPPVGTKGGAGAPGSGGGGGGFNGPNGCTCNTDVTDYPGNGGGAGGCGGAPAPAAGGGGGAFALYLWNANATLRSVKLVAGNGGRGGNGAVGSAGQAGGSGGGQGTAVAGGPGGPGGPGGTSSGATGGPSISLEQAGTSMPMLNSPIYVIGTGGAGGSSPVSALAGPTGIAVTTRSN